MTPTFNRAHTLPRTFASLQEQTFRNFEWIVIDDGSTDRTPELIEGWRAHSVFPICYVRQENLGKHVARNRAVTMARGRFFTGVDSDDWLLPTALHRLLEVWETIPDERREHFLGVADVRFPAELRSGPICRRTFSIPRKSSCGGGSASPVTTLG